MDDSERFIILRRKTPSPWHGDIAFMRKMAKNIKLI
jgi:hypothetical protein